MAEELVPTPDVGLFFADWLQRERRSLGRILCYRVSDFDRVKVWDFDEAGAFFHHYDTQYEAVARDSCECPLSHGTSKRFHHESRLPLHRPAQGDFSSYSHEYPLEGTQRVATCSNCSGRRTVTCHGCGGRGYREGTDSQGRPERTRCATCRGSGSVQCTRCQGEGQLLHYESKVFIWKHLTDREPILNESTERASMRSMIARLVARGGAYRVADFSESEVLASTGVMNSRIGTLIHRARAARLRLEQELEQRTSHHGAILFQEAQRHYVPIGFVNAEIASKYGQFFIAGNPSHHSTGSPPVRMSWVKVAGWLGLLTVLLALFFPRTMSGHEWLAALGGGLGLAGLLAVGRDWLRIHPDSWLIEDDDGLGGWLMVHLLAQGAGLLGLGTVRDPCYVDLFSPPVRSGRKGRNSFFCTLTRHARGRGRVSEVLLLSRRARQLFPDKVARLEEHCYQYTWVVSDRDPAEQDRIMSALVDTIAPRRRPYLKLSVIAAGGRAALGPADFPETMSKLDPEQLVCLNAALGDLHRQIQNGVPDTRKDQQLRQLITLIPMTTEV